MYPIKFFKKFIIISNIFSSKFFLEFLLINPITEVVIKKLPSTKLRSTMFQLNGCVQHPQRWIFRFWKRFFQHSAFQRYLKQIMNRRFNHIDSNNLQIEYNVHHRRVTPYWPRNNGVAFYEEFKKSTQECSSQRHPKRTSIFLKSVSCFITLCYERASECSVVWF